MEDSHVAVEILIRVAPWSLPPLSHLRLYPLSARDCHQWLLWSNFWLSFIKKKLKSRGQGCLPLENCSPCFWCEQNDFAWLSASSLLASKLLLEEGTCCPGVLCYVGECGYLDFCVSPDWLQSRSFLCFSGQESLPVKDGACPLSVALLSVQTDHRTGGGCLQLNPAPGICIALQHWEHLGGARFGTGSGRRQAWSCSPSHHTQWLPPEAQPTLWMRRPDSGVGACLDLPRWFPWAAKLKNATLRKQKPAECLWSRICLLYSIKLDWLWQPHPCSPTGDRHTDLFS